MARSKQTKSNREGNTGSQRKETRDERRIRLEQQAEAREKCFQLLPTVGGVIVVLLVAFAFYVNSVPPPPTTRVRSEPSNSPDHCGGEGGGSGSGGSGANDIPEFMYFDTTISPAGQAARAEAQEAAAAEAKHLHEAAAETMDWE